jgi:phosphoglycerate dehydrogenase-like enzyme
MSERRGPGEHRDPIAASAPIPPDRRPEPGPIAVLPEPMDRMVAAVRAAGGEVAALSDATRAVIWLAEKDPDTVARLLDEHPGIGWVQLPWAGVDAFSGVLAAHADRDRPLWTSAKGAYSEPVAEHALTLTLALLRGLPEKTRSTSWQTERQGISLFGRRVVIVGAGGIAVQIIRLLQPFETRITVVRRTAGDVEGAERTVTVDRLHEVLPEADVVILAAAATDGTANLIGAAELDLMQSDAVLVNIARGALVDSDALDAALRRGHLAGAGLDVTAPEPLPDGHPLWTAPRCVITSHTADTPDMVHPLLATRVEANVRAFLGDGAFVGVVDPKAGY